jgi:hypothetical protein
VKVWTRLTKEEGEEEADKYNFEFCKEEAMSTLMAEFKVDDDDEQSRREQTQAHTQTHEHINT